MSYVIQNFNDFNKKSSLTPRLKFLFILNNIEKFFIFLKLNTFLYITNNLNIFSLNHFSLFFKYFFSKQYFKILLNTNLNLIGQYNNNLTKSYIFNIYFYLNLFLNNNFIIFKNKNNSFNLINNVYNLPVQTVNVKINNSFYKNIFFLLMLINPFI